MNDDVVLVPGSRTAAKISEEELVNKILKEARSDKYFGCDEWTPDIELPWAVAAVIDEMDEKELLRIDRVTTFICDKEDLCYDGVVAYPIEKFTKKDSEKYLGLHTINDFTFYGCLCRIGCWCHVCFIAVYWDGKRLRVYQPIHGNTVSPNQEDPIFGLPFKKSWGPLCYDEDEYVKTYGFESGYDAKINWDAIENDMLTTINVN
jgi:hypothetical protein